MMDMPKYIWLLVIGTTISVTGGSFLWPLNTIYMHNELGKSLAFAGMILMFKHVETITGNLNGGILFDKYSAYKTILYGTGLAMLSAITLSFFHNIGTYSVLLVLIGFGTGITWPVMFAMAGSVWTDGGRIAFNALYVAHNLGVALGATLGGYVASISFNYIFMANATLFTLFFIMAFFFYRDMDEKRDQQMHTSVIEQSGEIKNKSSFKALLILSTGFLIAWFAYSQ